MGDRAGDGQIEYDNDHDDNNNKDADNDIGNGDTNNYGDDEDKSNEGGDTNDDGGGFDGGDNEGVVRYNHDGDDDEFNVSKEDVDLHDVDCGGDLEYADGDNKDGSDVNENEAVDSNIGNDVN